MPTTAHAEQAQGDDDLRDRHPAAAGGRGGRPAAASSRSISGAQNTFSE
ncbi:MAG: hypothetical protein WDM92_15145 [Caulobacteraceae bacterium]